MYKSPRAANTPSPIPSHTSPHGSPSNAGLRPVLLVNEAFIPVRTEVLHPQATEQGLARGKPSTLVERRNKCRFPLSAHSSACKMLCPTPSSLMPSDHYTANWIQPQGKQEIRGERRKEGTFGVIRVGFAGRKKAC